jgi:hypothetical protein
LVAGAARFVTPSNKTEFFPPVDFLKEVWHSSCWKPK